VNWSGHHIKPASLSNKKIYDFSKVQCAWSLLNVLLVHVNWGGFNLPGGHIEKGETPEEAFHREAFEKGYVKGQSNYI